LVACVIAVLFALAIPAGAQASVTTIGSDLSATPIGQRACVPACTDMQTVLPGRPLVSPCNGAVTHWRLRGSTSAGAPTELRVMHPSGGGKFTPSSTSAPLTIGSTSTVYQADTRLPIVSGDQIGVLIPNATPLTFLVVSPTAAFDFFQPSPPDGTAASPLGPISGLEELFNADVTCNPVITVTKALSPASDPGRFDLQVNGTTVKAGAGNGDAGSTTVAVGATVTVSEAAASGTNASDYDSSINCGAAGSGSGTSLVLQDLTTDTSCTITNVRRAVVVPPPTPVTKCVRQHHRRHRRRNDTNQRGCVNHERYHPSSRRGRHH
jgi:hypothetical protein